MFEDHQSDQTDNTAGGAPGVNGAATAGVGMNPNPTYVAPADSSAAPTVVLPSQSAGQASDGQHSDDHRSNDEAAEATPASAPASGQLEAIKRHALEQLSPLVNKLEQTPEEKYKTIMMMIQASDNQDLIHEAYENAQKISDEKTKAEALLNIVNEINYFTQKRQG